MRATTASDARVHVRAALPTELEWANACYRDAGFLPSTATDRIAIAECGGKRAGLGRVVPVQPGVAELGGMYVLPAFRGQAVARRIVDFLVQQSDAARLYCIPFAHLEAFYASCGFARVGADDAVPAPVAHKLAWCERQYEQPVCLLVRGRDAAQV